MKVDYFGDDSIGNVVAQAAGGAADKDSVKGIAKGIKGIVDAAGGKLDAVTAATTDTGKDAGKLFGNNGAAAAADASKAATAVSGVSGEQILKQIVDAAGKEDQNGAGAAAATNPIAAAIGTAAGAAFNANGMTKDDQIAAAIVLRGMAKGGKFGLTADNDDNGKGGVKNAVESAVKLLEKLITAGKEVEKVDYFGNDSIGNVVVQDHGGAADGNSVKGIAKGIKGIVETAGEKLDAVAAANTESGTVAGKLFGNNGAAAAADASKAAAAVSGVSGEQILKQIVAAAGKGDQQQNGVKAADAANPIAAAIGTAEAGAAFNADGMKKDDQIAAAIVLRGMAKDGKFGLKFYKQPFTME
nr:variable large family protein [Borreliella bavariensis]